MFQPVRLKGFLLIIGGKKEEGVQNIVFARPLLALVYSRGVI